MGWPLCLFPTFQMLRHQTDFYFWHACAFVKLEFKISISLFGNYDTVLTNILQVHLVSMQYTGIALGTARSNTGNQSHLSWKNLGR